MRRSAQIAKSVRTTHVAKTRRPLTAIIQPGSVANNSAVLMPSPP
ncbi:unannotated protein [freshwater metagenome]|uniref:Unannotated protein n=1 Tax=freshwater metagenome TaxID=449393 RepID=A0A6J7EBT3_9ZZZZ